MNGIRNPLGFQGGSNLTFGPDKYWEKDGSCWPWGRGNYSPIISIIHYFLNVAKANITGYDVDAHAKK